MAWKVSNETKVGALTAISITLLILGFNFLKGKNLTKKSRYLYARFQKIDGLLPANPVVMNGLSIGSIYKTEPGDADLNWILVTIRLDEDVNIPVNSLGTIKASLLGSPSLEILKGNATAHLQPGDSLKTQASGGFLGGMLSQLEPKQRNIDNVLRSVDSVLLGVNKVLDEKAQADLRATLSNLNAMSANLIVTTAALNKLVDAQTGTLTHSLQNLEKFTESLAGVRERLPSIVDNLEATTKNLSDLDMKATLNKLNETIGDADKLVAKINSTDGSIGALINDRKFYNNLSSTVNSLNILLQDLRLNPKRYVNISVFGRKNTAEPLMRPMAEDSVTQEQIRN